LDALDLSERTALCFGTEEKGLSQIAHDMADVFVQIPSYGFTQSFNVSVSVALCLSSIRKCLEASTIDWQLGEAEREALYLSWLLKTANRGLLLARGYFEDNAVRGPYA